MLGTCGSIDIDGAAVDGRSVKSFDDGISLELRQTGSSKGLGRALEDGSCSAKCSHGENKKQETHDRGSVFDVLGCRRIL